jgi:hypothetical protein
MSYFKPAEGMIIQGVMTNISEKNKTMLNIKERLKVLTFEQNPGLKRHSLDDYDAAFYRIVNNIIEFNEYVNGIDVKGERVRGKPKHINRDSEYLIISIETPTNIF